MKNVFDVLTFGPAKFVRITMKTELNKKMRAAARKALAGNQKITVVKSVHCSVNWDYSNVVNNRRIREGNETEFSALPSYLTKIGGAGSAIAHHKNNPTRFYLRYYNPQTLSETYYIGDRQATKTEVNQIKSAFYKRKDSGTQHLSAENQVQVRNVKFANVTEFWYKEQRWDLSIPETFRNMAVQNVTGVTNQ